MYTFGFRIHQRLYLHFLWGRRISKCFQQDEMKMMWFSSANTFTSAREHFSRNNHFVALFPNCDPQQLCTPATFTNCIDVTAFAFDDIYIFGNKAADGVNILDRDGLFGSFFRCI